MKWRDVEYRRRPKRAERVRIPPPSGVAVRVRTVLGAEQAPGKAECRGPESPVVHLTSVRVLRGTVLLESNVHPRLRDRRILHLPEPCPRRLASEVASTASECIWWCMTGEATGHGLWRLPVRLSPRGSVAAPARRHTIFAAVPHPERFDDGAEPPLIPCVHRYPARNRTKDRTLSQTQWYAGAMLCLRTRARCEDVRARHA